MTVALLAIAAAFMFGCVFGFVLSAMLVSCRVVDEAADRAVRASLNRRSGR